MKFKYDSLYRSMLASNKSLFFSVGRSDHDMALLLGLMHLYQSSSRLALWKHSTVHTRMKKDVNSMNIAPVSIRPACLRIAGIAMLPMADAPVRNFAALIHPPPSLLVKNCVDPPPKNKHGIGTRTYMRAANMGHQLLYKAHARICKRMLVENIKASPANTSTVIAIVASKRRRTTPTFFRSAQGPLSFPFLTCIVEQAAREAGSAGSGVTSLNLSHRALSDVSCLSSFSNLERLDLGYNCLVTLEGLSSCVNLKWLSVIENKLVSLKGVEGLAKLQVLNAGKNKLTRMDEVKSLTNLGALILNDNHISSICKLDRLLQLNTLVLSKNPVVTIGDALVEAKSLKKLSLSHCQVESIGSSLAACVQLKELRLAHNKITTIPSDLAKNVKILNLDLGNNFIERGSELKVLSELRYLRNLNLQGNPIAEKDTLAKKVMKIVPTLRILNAKPMEASSKNGSSRKESVSNNDEGVMSDHDPIEPNTKKKDKGKQSKQQMENPEELASQNTPPDVSATAPNKSELLDGKERKKEKVAKEHGKKRKSKRKDDKPSLNDTDRKVEKRSVNTENKDTEGIDDTEKPFAELMFSREDSPEPKLKEKIQGIAPDGKFVGGLVIDHTKKRKKLKGSVLGSSALELLCSVPEVGAGGLSGWDD